MRSFKRFVILILIILIAIGCIKENHAYVLTISEIVEQVKTYNSPAFVLAGDIDIFRISKEKQFKRFVRKYDKSGNVFLCDIKLQPNRILFHLPGVERFPVILQVDTTGHIFPICNWEDVKANPALLKSLALNKTKSNPEINKWNELLKVVINLNQGEVERARLLFDTIRETPVSPLYYFLGALLFPETARASEYQTSLNSLLEQTQYLDRGALFSILAETWSNHSLGPILVINNNIDLGIVEKDAVVDSAIVICNSGESQLRILGAYPSCNCLEISCPSIIEAGQSDTLNISYHPAAIGKDSKTIFMITNEENKTHTIKVTAHVQ